MEVHTSAVSRWIKEKLKETEVHVDVFEGHFTRSVSTSKAYPAGISVDDMLS